MKTDSQIKFKTYKYLNKTERSAPFSPKRYFTIYLVLPPVFLINACGQINIKINPGL